MAIKTDREIQMCSSYTQHSCCQFLQQNINSTVMVGPRSSQAVPVLEALKLVSRFQKVACAQSAADEASC